MFHIPDKFKLMIGLTRTLCNYAIIKNRSKTSQDAFYFQLYLCLQKWVGKGSTDKQEAFIYMFTSLYQEHPQAKSLFISDPLTPDR